MNKLLLFFFLILGFVPLLALGQQDSQYTQYMYNTVTVNPGYTGSRGVLSVLGLYRSQWLGLDGAPRTQTLTAHSPINKENKIGLGVSIIHDAAGPSQETSFNVSSSYTIQVFNQSKLSFGISAGGNLLNVDIATLRRYNANDELAQQDIDKKFSPAIGLGLYFRSNNFYTGISVPNVLETDHFDEGSLSSNSAKSSVLAAERINYYLIAGYVFEPSPLIKVKPAILTKYVEGSPWQIDLSTNVLFYDKFTIGASYRLSEAVSALAGFQISEGLMIGFSYDREVSQLGDTQFNNGTYEIIMRFELNKIYSRGVTPRFF